MIVTIGLPSQEMIWTFTAIDLSVLRTYSERNGIICPVINQQRARIEVARNEIVKAAAEINMPDGTKRKSDYILWIDSDMRFPYDTILRLQAHGKEIVGCNAMKRNESFQLAIPKDHMGRRLTPAEFKKGGLRQMGFIGHAVTLVKYEVYEKIKPPWYYAIYKDLIYKGEDDNFCQEAKEAGFRIWADMDLSREIEHIGQYRYNINKNYMGQK